MMHQERHGQLVLGRIVWPVPVDEVPKMLAEQKRIQSANPTPSVVFVDARNADVLPRPVADGLVEAFKSNRVKRLAVVAPPTFIAERQLDRVLREASAGADNRRLFSDVASAVVWLSEMLDAEERSLLANFVASGPA